MPPGEEKEKEESWLHAAQAVGYCVPEGGTGTDVLRGAACGGSKWQGLSVGLIVRKEDKLRAHT